MPTPLRSLALRAPGNFGLNTQQAAALSDPRWCLELSNAVFDEANRMAARKGWTNLTDEQLTTQDIEAIGEYLADKDSSEIISAANLKLFSGAEPTEVTGTITTPTANDWQFLNFNGKFVGVQQSHTPIVYSGASFANIVPASGTLPTGNAAVSAWGRLWIADANKLTIKFCGLLAETNWGGAGSGSLDTTEVWPDGIDFIQALAAYNNRLIIFGKRSVLIYTGAANPVNDLALEDVIPAAGCVARDSVQSIGTDLVYLSQNGLRSLQRGIVFSTLPLAELSTNVKDLLIDDINAATPTTSKSTYSREEGFYLLRLGGNYWMFDTRKPLQDGNLRAARWFDIGFKSVMTATDGTIYFGQPDGRIGKYDGYTDNGTKYTMRYLSTWLDLDSPELKILKRARLTVVTSGEVFIALQWNTDFVDSGEGATRGLSPARPGAEWGIAEWGIAEWSGGTSAVNVLTYPMSLFGHRVQVGLSLDIDGASVAFQALDLFHKSGRLAA